MRELDNRLMRHIDLLVERYASLESARNDIVAAYLLLEESYENGGKLLVAGNGGSAADAEHIVGELMKGFKLPRKPEADFAEKLVEENQELGSVLAENLQGALPAIALDGHPALSTAYMNDCEPLLCFAQQVNGYGKSGDVFLGISTSGNSKNVLYAATTAHAKGMKVIGLTGAKDSKLKDILCPLCGFFIDRIIFRHSTSFHKSRNFGTNCPKAPAAKMLTASHGNRAGRRNIRLPQKRALKSLVTGGFWMS